MISLAQVNAQDTEWALAFQREASAHKARDKARDTYYRQELARLGFTTETVCRSQHFPKDAYRWTGNLTTEAPSWADGRIITWIEFGRLRKDGDFHNGISRHRERVADVLATLEGGNEVLL